MTPSRMLRPVLLGLAGLATSSCSLVEGDPHRFESMAQYVADIPLDGGARPVRTSQESGLRPAIAVAKPVGLIEETTPRQVQVQRLVKDAMTCGASRATRMYSPYSSSRPFSLERPSAKRSMMRALGSETEYTAWPMP